MRNLKDKYFTFAQAQEGSEFVFNENSPTYYKRKLPNTLIGFSSEKGKKLFQQALAEGNLECYFPLSEQFLTQMAPPTCGATTLTMVLNALGLDPKKRWKGIWRWYSEETIHGITKEILDKGMDISLFAHLARQNQASIHYFHYPFDVNQKKQQLKGYCGDKQDFMMASLETFKICVLASCRRSGLFLVVNQSRKALGQTGEGHFMPVGGFHLASQNALMFDVARFKYPMYWCDINLLYKSLSYLDTDTKIPRGFALMSKQFEMFSPFCRVSQDLISTEKFNKHLCNVVSVNKTDSNLNEYFLQLLDNLGEDCRVLLVYYLFEFLNMCQYPNQQNKGGDTTINPQNNCSFFGIQEFLQEVSKLELFEKLKDNEDTLLNNKIYQLILEFIGKEFIIPVITVLFLSLPQQIYQACNNNLQKEIIKLTQSNNYFTTKALNQQVQFMKNVLGTTRDFCRHMEASKDHRHTF